MLEQLQSLKAVDKPVLIMEDQRVVWMKDRVYAALRLRDDKLFEGLLQREDKWAERELLGYLDQPVAQYSPAVVFYPLEGEVEEEVEVVEGKPIKGEEEKEKERFVHQSPASCNIVSGNYVPVY